MASSRGLLAFGVEVAGLLLRVCLGLPHAFELPLPRQSWSFVRDNAAGALREQPPVRELVAAEQVSVHASGSLLYDCSCRQS